MRVSGTSYSADKKLSRCEQMFSYRYDQKLKRRIKKKGLWRGDWIHQLMEAYRRKQDWKKKWRELKKNEWDKLFDEEKEDYGLDFPQQIFELMEHYIEHWSGEDKNWKVIQVEKSYEKMTKYGWPVRWKADFLVKEGNRTVLIENKNKKSIPEVNERMLAPQVHAYCYLLSLMGIKVDTILWDYIRTEPVPRPQILKDGSLSKRKINTDQRSYLKALKEAGIHPESEEDSIGVQNKLKSLPETLSLLRIRNKPNLEIGKMFVRQWILRAHRAEKITHPMRNFDKDCKFDCDYYDVCMLDMLGRDTTSLRKKDFIQIDTSTQEETKK